MMSVEALAWEQDKIRRPETIVLWLCTQPEEFIDGLRKWIEKL